MTRHTSQLDIHAAQVVAAVLIRSFTQRDRRGGWADERTERQRIALGSLKSARLR